VAEIITVADLPAAMQTGELVDAMVAGANAKASRVAPCLTWADEDVDHPAPTADQLAEAKLVLIGAVKRWFETSSGALSSQTAGPYNVTLDTRQRTGFNLWPSEIEGLQDICSSGSTGSSSAFSITPSSSCSAHMPWCSVAFGAYCSCGADLTDYEYPLYEGGVLSTDGY
jgi:hypothetical protein